MAFGTSALCRVRKEIRSCQHPSCGKKFEGSPTSLYCVEHRTRKCRAERSTPKVDLSLENLNQNLQPEANSPCRTEMTCSLEGCGRKYQVAIYPDHFVYPKFCEAHRTEFKRKHFLKMVGRGKTISYENPETGKWNDHEVQIEEYALNRQGDDLLLFKRKKRRRGSKQEILTSF